MQPDPMARRVWLSSVKAWTASDGAPLGAAGHELGLGGFFVVPESAPPLPGDASTPEDAPESLVEFPEDDPLLGELSVDPADASPSPGLLEAVDPPLLPEPGVAPVSSGLKLGPLAPDEQLSDQTAISALR